MNNFAFVAIGFVVVLLLIGSTDSSRFVFPLFDLHGNGIFGRELHLESRDPLLPVEVTVSMATGSALTVTLQPNGTERIDVIPPSILSASQLDAAGIEVISNGSLKAYAILSHDVILPLMATTELGCEYRVVSLSDPSNGDNNKNNNSNNNNRILRPIEIFLISIEDNTTVVLQPGDNETTETTLTTMNNLEMFSAKTEIGSEGLWIKSNKPVSVFVLQKIHETGNMEINETTAITVMQLIPLKFWSARYTLRCSNCEDLKVNVSIFAASSRKVTKVRVKDKTSDRVLTISRSHQTAGAILALDKSPTTVDAEDRIQLLIHEGACKNDHKDRKLELTIDDPGRVLILVCSGVGVVAVVGTESLLCAVDHRRSVEFDLKGTRMGATEIGDKRVLKYGHNYRFLRGTQLASTKDVQSAVLANASDVSKTNTRQADLTGFYRGRGAAGLGSGLSGGGGEDYAENGTRSMEEDATADVGKRNQALETVKNDADQTRDSPSTAKIDSEKPGSPSTKSNEPLQFHKNSLRRLNSKIPPNANYAANRDDTSMGGTDRDVTSNGKSPRVAPPDDGLSVNGIKAVAITENAFTKISQTFAYKPHRDEITLKKFGRHPRSTTSRPANVSDANRYNPINPKGKDQHNRPMHKTLNMFVMKKDIVDKAGHRVVNYFEIGAEEVERNRVGMSPTVIAVITSLCGAVFFVVACILGFVITEVFCTKGRIQRSKISPFVELTNSWY